MKNYLLLGIIFCSLLTFGQDYRAVWQQCYGDEGDNHYTAICPTSDGYLFAYNNYSSENCTNFHGAMDIWIQRFDTLNNRTWEICYGGSSSEVPIKLIQINDNEFYLLGCTLSTDGDVQSQNNGFSEVWVIKITGEGNIIWSKTYGGDGDEDPRDMVLTPDGGFVFMDRLGMGGGDVTNFYGSGDVWLCKCDSMGNIEWEKTLGNDGLDNGLSLLINSKGNLMMLGAAQKTGGMISAIPDGSWADVWLVELDMQGNIVWQECYGGSEYDCGLNLVEIDDGYIFTGVSASNDGDVSGHHGGIGMDGNIDLWAVRINQAGEIVWQKSLGGTGNEESTFLNISSTNEIVIIGSTGSFDGDVSGNHSLPNSYNRDVWLLHVNMEGELLSQQCFGSSWDDAMHLHNVIQKTDEDFLVSAFSQQYPADGDVQCSVGREHPFYYDVWLFELKDCQGLFTTTPARPIGPHVVCSSLTPQSTYYVHAAALAQAYEWSVYPAECGTLVQQDTTISITWAAGWEGDVALRARALNECGPSEWSVTHYAAVHTCIGITELSKSGIAVWPNPANDILNIALPQNMQLPIHITLSDLTGRVLQSQQLTQSQTAINLSSLPQGVFFCHLASTEINVTAKIIKGL